MTTVSDPVAPYVVVEDWILKDANASELRVFLATFGFAGNGCKQTKDQVRGVSQKRLAVAAGMPYSTTCRALKGCRDKGFLTIGGTPKKPTYVRNKRAGSKYARVPIEAAVRRSVSLSGESLRLLVAYMMCAKKDGASWPKQSAITEMTGILPPNISRAKSQLMAAGQVTECSSDCAKPYRNGLHLHVTTPEIALTGDNSDLSPVSTILAEMATEVLSPVSAIERKHVDNLNTEKVDHLLLDQPVEDVLEVNGKVLVVNDEVPTVGAGLFAPRESAESKESSRKRSNRLLADEFFKRVQDARPKYVVQQDDKIELMTNMKRWQKADWTESEIRTSIDVWFKQKYVRESHTDSNAAPAHRSFLTWVRENRGRTTPQSETLTPRQKADREVATKRRSAFAARIQKVSEDSP